MDGALVPWRDANVHFLTHALHYGSGVFEGIRAYDGVCFKLQEHNERLAASAKILGFDLPFSVEEINAACYAALKANNVVDGYLRPMAWRGSEHMAVSSKGTRIHLAIACWSWPSYFSTEARMRGLKLMVSPWRRPAPDTAPVKAKACGLYMIGTLSKNMAEEQGFDDAIMYDYRGLVAEATGANLFMISDGKLHTPTPDCFLDGITRRTVMDLARRRNIEVIERHITSAELAKAQEVFLCGTAVEVAPVGRIGETVYTPGQMTLQLMDDYTTETHKQTAKADVSSKEPEMA